MIQLFNDDCLKVLPTIPDKSIDLILTDPPYGTTACKWDSVIPFEPMWKELKRIIKNNGCIALFGSEPFSSALRMSNINNYRYDWVWDKVIGTGFLNANKMPLKGFENILVFYKNLPTYNPIKTKGKPFKDSRNNPEKRREIKEYLGTKPKPNKQDNKGDRHPRGFIKISSRNNNPIHPTQKPVPLLEYLIKTYTNEGDTVLDFTMGSGTTGVACKNTNRNFIGIEMDKNYFDIAKNRIEDEACLR
jgi:DNA modification methylase